MNKDYFSPTPWKVVVRHDDMVVLVDAEEDDICEMDEWDNQYEHEQTANFLLMSASPRLLHALEKLVQVAALELGEAYEPVVEARAAIKAARSGL